MFYIDEDELFAVMSERDLFDLTDNLSPSEKTALLESVNEDAVGEIHGYLRGRYTLPIATPDAFFKGIVKDVMKFRLYQRRDILNVPEIMLKQYATTIGKLKDIQKGILVLDATKPSSTNGSNNQGGSNVLYANKQIQRTGIF